MAVPHRTLEDALAAMRFRVLPEPYCLVGFEGPPTADDLAALEPPAQLVCEAEETTLLIPAGRLAGVRSRHPRARFEEGLRWIRFEAPMDWELVGFLARVTDELARAGVPLGAVCSYARDHLFVAERHLPRARRALSALFPEERDGPNALRGASSSD